jgi:hypothetical protein
MSEFGDRDDSLRPARGVDPGGQLLHALHAAARRVDVEHDGGDVRQHVHATADRRRARGFGRRADARGHLLGRIAAAARVVLDHERRVAQPGAEQRRVEAVAQLHLLAAPPAALGTEPHAPRRERGALQIARERHVRHAEARGRRVLHVLREGHVLLARHPGVELLDRVALRHRAERRRLRLEHHARFAGGLLLRRQERRRVVAVGHEPAALARGDVLQDQGGLLHRPEAMEVLHHRREARHAARLPGPFLVVDVDDELGRHAAARERPRARQDVVRVARPEPIRDGAAAPVDLDAGAHLVLRVAARAVERLVEQVGVERLELHAVLPAPGDDLHECLAVGALPAPRGERLQVGERGPPVDAAVLALREVEPCRLHPLTERGRLLVDVDAGVVDADLRRRIPALRVGRLDLHAEAVGADDVLLDQIDVTARPPVVALELPRAVAQRAQVLEARGVRGDLRGDEVRRRARDRRAVVDARARSRERHGPRQPNGAEHPVQETGAGPATRAQGRTSRA